MEKEVPQCKNCGSITGIFIKGNGWGCRDCGKTRHDVLDIEACSVCGRNVGYFVNHGEIWSCAICGFKTRLSDKKILIEAWLPPYNLHNPEFVDTRENIRTWQRTKVKKNG